jgi:hypothetical protein
VQATAITGSFDQTGRFVSSGGAGEGDFEQDLVGTLRVLRDGQVTVVVPMVETFRRAAGISGVISDFGGGLGDLQVSARYDPIVAGASQRIPGIAVLASVILPTGRPLEQATHSLSSDTTGTGAVQGALGLSLEQTFGKVLVNVTGSATLHSARTVGGVHTLLGPAFNVIGALGYSFDAGPVAAITAGYTASLDNRTDGVTMPDSGRTQLRFGISAGYAVSDTFRLQGGLFGDPPARYFGQSEPAGVGLSVALFRVW